MVRAMKESERADSVVGDRAEDAPMTAESQSEAPEPATL